MTLPLLRVAHSKPIVGLLALATHFVLHSAEWDNSFHVFLGVWALAFGSIAITNFLQPSHAASLVGAFSTTIATAIVYFTVLATSILVHRGFFHRLRSVRKHTKHIPQVLETDSI